MSIIYELIKTYRTKTSLLSMKLIFSPTVQQPLVDNGLLIIETSQSHSDTPHSVGLLWTCDQPDAETST